MIEEQGDKINAQRFCVDLKKEMEYILEQEDWEDQSEILVGNVLNSDLIGINMNEESG